MSGRVRRRIERRLAGRRDAGVVAVLTAILLTVFVSLCAFAVDVGNWYVVGEQQQRAADAAALAGVVSLPGDPTTATSTAKKFSSLNGYADGGLTSVSAGVDGKPTRLRVTVSTTVKNYFGGLLGVPTTQISRTAVADYAGPVAMGSPCNRFGNNPDGGTADGAACAGVTGQYWANVNSPKSAKSNGDAYQSTTCASNVDGCASGTNTDYATDGYFYTVSVKRPMTALTIQLFDPAFVNTGLDCTGSTLTNASTARNDLVTDETTRYATGAASNFCTGDSFYSGTTPMSTQFTLRAPGASAWDPLSFPIADASCQRTYTGYTGDLSQALNQYTLSLLPNPSYNAYVATNFRRWVTLCTVLAPQVGDYLLQVKTNGLSTDASDAGNRFAIRAVGGVSSDSDYLSISGREKMGVYSNKPSSQTQFYLARVPSSAAGMALNIRLFDVGDSTKSGNIIIGAPPGSGVTFTNCKALGPNTGTLPGCTLYNVSSSTGYQGRWQQVSVPIPTTYRCTDSDPSACWVRLTYDYLTGAPTDVTSWTASIEGDPVRLVQ